MSTGASALRRRCLLLTTPVKQVNTCLQQKEKTAMCRPIVHGATADELRSSYRILWEWMEKLEAGFPVVLYPPIDGETPREKDAIVHAVLAIQRAWLAQDNYENNR